MLYFQRKNYVKYAKVFPLAATFEFKIPSKWYRRAVGSLEVICGLAMAIIPNRKQFDDILMEQKNSPFQFLCLIQIKLKIQLMLLYYY